MATYSEDALFKALLKNKPPQQPPKPAAPAPRKEAPIPVPPAQPAFQKQEQVIETRVVSPPVKPVDLEPVIESINRLNSNINQMHGMIKTMIFPVLVLILVVAIGILLRAK